MDELEVTDKALEAHRLLNRTAAPYPGQASVSELFEQCVARFGDSVAVVHGSRRLTYRELNALANRIAARLLAHGSCEGRIVGVCARRSPELIASLLAVLKCGGAYLPVDASWPDDRLAALFEQAQCTVALGDAAANLAARLPGVTTVLIEDAASIENAASIEDTDAADDPGDPAATTSAEAIAYVNFTSGSTGRPKAVPIQHRAIARLVFRARYTTLDESSVLLQLAPVTFDAATFEIWGALLHGGTCVLYPSAFVRFSELQRVLEQEKVTDIFLTTALFNSILDEAPQTLDSVGRILTGGEAHSLRHIARALDRYGPDRLTSVYGPTECTTFATYHPVRALRADENALPIGVPIQNTRAYVVEAGRLCEPGETGEVLLAGPGLSPGYLASPEATAHSFATVRLGGVIERVYRTGDRAYLRDDGVLVFQGRLDDQVKINGYRIELGEVAHHLDACPAVKQSHVLVTEDPTGQKKLVAFVVPEHEGCTPAAVRGYLAGRLPGYMIPGEIRIRDGFPLSATGKVDRAALLAAGP